MKRLIAVLVVGIFTFSQTPAAYAQEAGYPIYGNSNTGALSGDRSGDIYKRRVEAENASGGREDEDEKERAMINAIFEARYKKKEYAEKLKEPAKGMREKGLIRKYQSGTAEAQERDEGMGVSLNGNGEDEGPALKKKLKPVKIGRRPIGRDNMWAKTVDKANEELYPLKISGDYQMAWGYDLGDGDSDGRRGTWKDADFNKANLVYTLDNQYVFGAERDNTYDKRIYDRFRLKIESTQERGFNYLSEIVIDPWSFVGKTDYFMLTDQNSQVPIQLRYWSNTQSTIDERIWLTSGTDYINIPEIKVNNGATLPIKVASRWNNTVFDIPPMEINRDFRPLRKLEMGYRNDYADIKIFPLAASDHAYTSDDPLRLSNRYIYWEPSPWLNRWEPALYFPTTGDFRRGSWKNDIAFEARDSDYNYLTLLRGLSFEANYENIYFAGAIASPMHPWQWYDSVNTLPAALRAKYRFPENFYVGWTYGSDYAFYKNKIDAFNYVMGMDAGYEMPGVFGVRGEFARSYDKSDRKPHDYRIMHVTEAKGNAYRIEGDAQLGGDKDAPMFKFIGSFTHMGDNFRTRLSNYRNTRADQFWGKHISFVETDPNFEAFKIGDGIDIGRNTYHFRMENNFFDKILNSFYDMRFVRAAGGGKIEDVYREEVTITPIANLVGKFLLRYQDLPNTTANTDPYIITDFISGDNTNEFLQNTEITAGEDADVWTYSAGFHYDPINWLGLEGIYERTNDHDVFPQYVFNDASFRDLGNIRDLQYFLYSQGLIALPDYDAYNVYKARIFYRPMDSINIKLEYVLNTFKHATGRDDNISHYGVEADIKFTDRLRLGFGFTRSQLIDLFRQQQDMQDLPFDHHDNIAAQLEYAIDDGNSFIIQFGEFYVPKDVTPVPWILNTVDTQYILRAYLKGKF